MATLTELITKMAKKYPGCTPSFHRLMADCKDKSIKTVEQLDTLTWSYDHPIVISGADYQTAKQILKIK